MKYSSRTVNAVVNNKIKRLLAKLSSNSGDKMLFKRQNEYYSLNSWNIYNNITLL